MVAGDPRWRDLAHPQAVRFFDRYRLDDAVRLVHTTRRSSAEGDLTETRDYRTYTAAFDDASDRKWDAGRAVRRPRQGRRPGLRAGGLLERASRDPRLGESDLYGVDVSRHLVAEAEHRKAQGVFANPNVYFASATCCARRCSPARSVNTTMTIALTHEISQLRQRASADLELLAERIFEHTAPGGVWINSDVLGPDDGDAGTCLRFERRSRGCPDRRGHERVDSSGRSTDRIASLTAGRAAAPVRARLPGALRCRCDVAWDRRPAGRRTVPLRGGRDGVPLHPRLRRQLALGVPRAVLRPGVGRLGGRC